MMPSSHKVIRFIRRNILLFSGVIFATSALLLLVAISQEKHFTVAPNKADVEPWLAVLEEIFKGLLAASAVAFLYDWILKLESTEEIRYIIQSELETLKFGMKGAEPNSQFDHSIEFIFSPLNDIPLGEQQNHFCRMSVHCRFLSGHSGDEVKFMLLTSGEHRELPKDNTPCLFYWDLDEPPSTAPNEQWFEVTNLQIDNELWTKVQPQIENGIITVRFRKPKSIRVPRKQFVTYDFDIRTIENYSPPKTFSFFISQKMINSIFRVDARPLKARGVRSNISASSKKILQSKYVRAPEADGTCQMLVNDVLEPGGAITFTIIGDALPKNNSLLNTTSNNSTAR
jgi:hypothetical protein